MAYTGLVGRFCILLRGYTAVGWGWVTNLTWLVGLTSLGGYSSPLWAENEAVPGVEAAAVARVIAALLLIVLLIIALAWGLRRYSSVGGAVLGQMKVLGSLPVGNRERIVLVQVGETQLLLGVAPGRVQTLHVLDKPLTVQAYSGNGAHPGAPFAERLRSMMQHHSNQQ